MHLVPLIPADLMGGVDSDSDLRLDEGFDLGFDAPIGLVPAVAAWLVTVPALPPSPPPPLVSPPPPRSPSPPRAAELGMFEGFVRGEKEISEALDTVLEAQPRRVAGASGPRRGIMTPDWRRRHAMAGSAERAVGFASTLLRDEDEDAVEMDDVAATTEVHEALAEQDSDESDDPLL
jgi:hypothetical protein